MISTHRRHDYFNSTKRPDRSVSNDRCQNILYKAVFEHFAETPEVAALLLASTAFQNSSFGANFLANFVFNDVASKLFSAVLSPSSCFSLQFAPSLQVENSQYYTLKIENDVTNFVVDLAKTKYFVVQLPSLMLSRASDQVLSSCFQDSVTWRNLRALNLEYNVLDDSPMAGISKSAPHLTSLNLASCRCMSSGGLQHISELAGLTSLNLSDAETIDDLGLQHFSKSSTMMCLNLTDCRKVTDAGFEHLSYVAGLTTLVLSRCAVTDVGLEHIAYLSNISHLDLEMCVEITDAGLEHISVLDSISTLILSGCNITDAGLQHVAKLSRMRVLDLSFCNSITDAGIEHVSTLQNVTNLNLRGSSDDISDSGLQDISKKMLAIETLDLSQCFGITDVGMEHVSRLARMTDLDLSYTKITDVGLAFVARLSKLTMINLNNCRQITDVGVRGVAKIPGIIDIDVRCCDLRTDFWTDD